MPTQQDNEPRTSGVTPEGRLSYPALMKPKANNLKQGKMEYSTDILFPKNADLSKLVAMLTAALAKTFGPDKTKWPKNLRTPIKDQAEIIERLALKGKPTDHLQAGAKYIRVASESKPEIVDAQMNEVIESREVYGGRWARASVAAWGYSKGSAQGVTLFLNNIQLLRNDTSFGGKTNATDDFEAVVNDDNFGNIDDSDLLG